jgi:aromatic-L-amino-acid decarboxylase
VSTASELPSLRLDATREEVLEHASTIVSRAWRSFDRPRPGQPSVDERLHGLLRAALPSGSSSALAALDDAARILDTSLAQPRPRFFAFVGSSGLEIGVLGDLLASCFDVNLALWAGGASEVEEQAVRWVSEFVGFPAAAGAFTSGGTISNVTALAAARERTLPGTRRTVLHRALRGEMYCSQ